MKTIFTFFLIILVALISQAGRIDRKENTIPSEQLNKIKEAIQQNNAKWIAEENSISKLAMDEIELLFGLDKEPIQPDYHQRADFPKVQHLPATFNWRDNNGDWLTPVKNQHVQQCGGCWAFAAVAQVESWWKITNEKPDSMIDLSEQYLISCSPAGNCTEGGWEAHALEWISRFGIPSEECMPYMASDTVDCENCCDNWEEEAVKIPGWSYVTTDQSDIMIIKNAVYRRPVISSMDVYEDFRYYSGGVYEHVTGNFIAGHVVVIYGWDDAQQCWLCKNSIGQDWGEEGNFRIKWGDCRIGEQTLTIWNEMSEGSSFTVYPHNVITELKQGESIDTLIKIINKNNVSLEFTTFIYGTESTFHPSAYNSYDGSSIWCGDEDLKGYGNWWIKYLDTPALDLSMTSTPELSCLMKWSTDGSPIRQFDGRDGGNLMISVDGGKNFELLVPNTPLYNCESMLSHWMYGIPFGTGSWSGMTDWQNVRADLSDYKSDEVIIRFTFMTTNANCTTDNPAWKGLFIDSLVVKDDMTLIYENQGTNIDDMRRSGIGGKSCDWIEISENPGIIAAGDSMPLNINIYTTELDVGVYKGSIVLSTNNKYYEYYEIPVELNLVPPSFISSQSEMIPHKFALFQNYPNPFNPITTIEFLLPEAEFTTLTIYNTLGQQVVTLLSDKLNAGSYKYNWDASGMASGVYYYRLVAGEYVDTKKLVVLK